MKAHLIFEPLLGSDKSIEFFHKHVGIHSKWIKHMDGNVFVTPDIEVNQLRDFGMAITNLFHGVTFHGYFVTPAEALAPSYYLETVFNDIGCNIIPVKGANCYLMRELDMERVQRYLNQLKQEEQNNEKTEQ